MLIVHRLHAQRFPYSIPAAGVWPTGIALRPSKAPAGLWRGSRGGSNRGEQGVNLLLITEAKPSPQGCNRLHSHVMREWGTSRTPSSLPCRMIARVR
jgi:hypothetical protein